MVNRGVPDNIYSLVLEGNEYIISQVKPGQTLRGLNNLLIKFYEEKLKEIGLLENGKTVRDYYWHGVSHMLGLETHDVQLSGHLYGSTHFAFKVILPVIGVLKSKGVL